MAVYEESGLRFDLPEGTYFRLAEAASYRPLSGQHLKEMDFAWVHEGKLVLLEVKDFTETTARLVLAVGLDLPAHLKVHLGALRTALNHRLKGRLKLVGVEAVALMDYDTLISRPTFSPYVSRLAPVPPVASPLGRTL